MKYLLKHTNNYKTILLDIITREIKMVKFAHLADIHLGGWKQKEMQDLNLESFKTAINICIKERVEFILISGDLFDSAYPPIEILKETFSEFKKIKEAGIKCFLIAGSHDFSASGKTFLDVLEKAGFCVNVAQFEERENGIFLNPTIHNNIAIYGYSGKKSGLELEDLKKIKLQDSPFSKILMLHTTLTEIRGDLPIESISLDELPKADYYALGHIHKTYNKDCLVYPGPLFPNNFQELKELGGGSFYIIEKDALLRCEKKEIKLKEVINIEIEIDNSLIAKEKILSELEKRELKDKIILLKIYGKLKQGKISDLKFSEIESFAKEKGAYFLLRNISSLETEDFELEVEVKDIDSLEDEVIKKYRQENQSTFNNLIEPLIKNLEIEKQEDEKNLVFESRIYDSAKKILNLE